MQPGTRSLEINVISGEELHLNGHSINKNTFATVQTDQINYATTKMDKTDGSFPIWEEKFNLELPINVRYINVRIQCKTWAGIEVIGSANVPVSDFIGDYTPAYYLHFLSYRLRDSRGKRNGIVNLSVRVRDPYSDWEDGVEGDKRNFGGGFRSGVPNSFMY